MDFCHIEIKLSAFPTVRTCPARPWQGTAVSRVGYELNVLAQILLYHLLRVHGPRTPSPPFARLWGR